MIRRRRKQDWCNPQNRHPVSVRINEIKRHKTGVTLIGVLFVAALAGAAFGLYKFSRGAQSAPPATPLKVVPLDNPAGHRDQSRLLAG